MQKGYLLRNTTALLLAMSVMFTSGCGKGEINANDAQSESFDDSSSDEDKTGIDGEIKKAEPTASPTAVPQAFTKDIVFYDKKGKKISYEKYVKLVKKESGGQFSYFGDPMGLLDQVELDPDINKLGFAYNLVPMNMPDDTDLLSFFKDGWKFDDKYLMGDVSTISCSCCYNQDYPYALFGFNATYSDDDNRDDIPVIDEDFVKNNVKLKSVGFILPRKEKYLNDCIFPSVILPRKVTFFTSYEDVKKAWGEPADVYEISDRETARDNGITDKEELKKYSDKKFRKVLYANEDDSGGYVLMFDDEIGLYGVIIMYPGVPNNTMSQESLEEQARAYLNSLPDDELNKMIEDSIENSKNSDD